MAILTGFFLTIDYIGTLNIPKILEFGIINKTFFEQFNQLDNRILFVIIRIARILGAMTLIGLIINFYSLCRDKNAALVSWVSTMAIIGLGISFISQFSHLNYYHQINSHYLFASDEIKKTLLNLPLLTQQFDYEMTGQFFTGLWLVTVSYLAITNKFIPLYLVIGGFLLGTLQLISFISLILGLGEIMNVSLLLYAIIFPIWSIAEGLFLYKSQKQN